MNWPYGNCCRYSLPTHSQSVNQFLFSVGLANRILAECSIRNVIKTYFPVLKRTVECSSGCLKKIFQNDDVFLVFLFGKKVILSHVHLEHMSNCRYNDARVLM